MQDFVYQQYVLIPPVSQVHFNLCTWGVQSGRKNDSFCVNFFEETWRQWDGDLLISLRNREISFHRRKKKSHGVVTPKRHSGFPKRTPRNPMAARVSRTSSVEVGFIGSEAVEWILGFDGFVDDYFWWKTALQFATEKVVLGPKKECNSSIRLPIIISRGLCWISVENCDGDDGEWWRWWWWWWWWMMVMIVMVVNDSDDGDDGVGGQWWWWWWGVRGDDEEEDTRSSDNDNNDDDNDGDDDNDDDNAVGGGGGYDDVYIWHQQLWIVVMIVFIMASLLSVNHHHSRNISLTGCFAARHRFMSTKHHTPMMPCDFRWFHSQCRVFLLVIWWILWLVLELDEGKRFEGKIARRVWLVYLFWSNDSWNWSVMTRYGSERFGDLFNS